MKLSLVEVSASGRVMVLRLGPCIVSCHHMPQITLPGHSVFFQLKFYLDMHVLHTMTAKWLKKKQHGSFED